MEKLEIEIEQRLKQKINGFCDLIDWPINKFINYLLKMMIDFYSQAIDPFHNDISERIWNEFLERPFLKKLTTVFEGDNT